MFRALRQVVVEVPQPQLVEKIVEVHDKSEQESVEKIVDSLFLRLPRGTKDIRRREDHPSAQSDWDRGWDGGPESGVVFAVADKFVRENRGYDLDEIYLWPRFLLC